MVYRELAAVLFDMDGTLVDTEKVWDVALRELAARYGGVLSDAGRIAMVGAAAERTMELLFADLDMPPVAPEAGADWLDARMVELFADGMEWKPGARELLAAVRAAGLATALVTNTRRGLVTVALLTLGAHNFTVVTCGDEVPFTKPHPAPYVQTARALGLAPEACAVLEDSPAGIASAQAAGCAVLGVPSEIPLDDLDVPTAASLLDVDVDTLRRLVAAG